MKNYQEFTMSDNPLSLFVNKIRVQLYKKLFQTMEETIQDVKKSIESGDWGNVPPEAIEEYLKEKEKGSSSYQEFKESEIKGLIESSSSDSSNSSILMEENSSGEYDTQEEDGNNSRGKKWGF